MTDHIDHLCFLENMEKVDRAIRQADGLEQMLEDTMRVVMSIFEADRVWFFYPCDPDAEIYTVPMECARPEYPGAFSMGVNVPASPALSDICRDMLDAEGWPISRGAGSEKPVPEDQQAQFSVKSILCMSIFPKQGAPWAVGMHQCSREREWSEDERQLCQEIGRRLADGLSSFLILRDLRESRAKLLQAQYIAKIGDFTWDIVSGGATWSDGMYRLLKYDKSEKIDAEKVNADIHHPDDLERIIKWLMDSIASGRKVLVPNEYRLVCKDGSVIYVRTEGRLEYKDGKAVKLFGTCQNITDRKLAEEALLESEEKYRALFEHSADAMLLIDGDTFVDCNNAAVRMLRCKNKDELLQMHPWDISPEFQADDTPSRKVAKETLASMPQERSRRFEWIHRRADGELFPVEVLLTYIPIGEKPLVHVVWRDLTEREQLIKKLESQNAELERFTYTVSHDLKSPLITIKGFLGVLEQDLGTHFSGEISEHMARIGTAADRMFAFLEDLLELSRVGRLANPPSDIHLAKLVGEAVDLLNGPITAGNIQVCVEQNLPVIRGDRVRLREVYQNLIENAVKYMGSQPNPKIEIGIRRDAGEKGEGEKGADKETVFFVRDNGIGIDSRFQDKIFELFDKLDPKTEGTGVGLALVSRILEVHGGRIWLESEGEGTGSTFCFTLAPPK